MYANSYFICFSLRLRIKIGNLANSSDADTQAFVLVIVIRGGGMKDLHISIEIEKNLPIDCPKLHRSWVPTETGLGDHDSE